MLTNIEIRQKWDRKFTEIKVIGEVDIFRQVVYWSVVNEQYSNSNNPFITILGVWLCTMIQEVVKGREESQDLTYILYKHATHPSRPVLSGVIRYTTVYNSLG